MSQKIDVAAYIWPAYTGKEDRTRIFWPDGEGEWQTVRKSLAKFEGHTWPRKPLLGYQDEADPAVMEQQIDLALSHGVNVFAYDWYWFDRRPFLEQCLDDGFLKAKNCNKMKFYLMWANHDANYTWDRRLYHIDHRKCVIWGGACHEDDYREICDRWLKQYLTLPNYYRIDGKPLLAIYDLKNFIDTFGTIEHTAEMMKYLDGKAKEAGLPGIHFQMIHHGKRGNVSGVDGGTLSYDEVLPKLPFDSVTHYQFCHCADVNQDYTLVLKEAEQEWDRMIKSSPVPYYPHVSVGWDNSPRSIMRGERTTTGNTPDKIEIALRDARDLAIKLKVPMVTVNSWNEWTESSYLLPDDLYGYGYLDAVKKVFVDNQ